MINNNNNNNNNNNESIRQIQDIYQVPVLCNIYFHYYLDCYKQH